ARVRLVSTAAETAAGVMPDVSGRTLREALAILTPLGLRVELEGRGRVAQQSPAAGEPVEADAVVRLTLVAGGARVGVAHWHAAWGIRGGAARRPVRPVR